MSLQSRDNFFSNLRQKDQKRGSKAESFLSKIKPQEMMWGVPKNLDLENLDDISVKTPKKDHLSVKEDRFLNKNANNILPFSESDQDLDNKSFD